MKWIYSGFFVKFPAAKGRPFHDIAHSSNQVWPLLPMLGVFTVTRVPHTKFNVSNLRFQRGAHIDKQLESYICMLLVERHNRVVSVCEPLSGASAEWSFRHCIMTEIKVRIIKRNLCVGYACVYLGLWAPFYASANRSQILCRKRQRQSRNDAIHMRKSLLMAHMRTIAQ